MSFKKKLLAIAAVGGLTAATAVPAMAFENEFHGMYRVYGWMTNAEGGATSFNVSKDAKTSSYVEQRARLMYIAKASDDLKLVTHFELDTTWGGNKTAGNAKYGTSTDAGVLDADGISLETKNVYLDFKLPDTSVNMKVGVQPFFDTLNGTFGNFDGSGASVSAKFGAFTPTLAWFRVYDEDAGFPMGKKTVDLSVVDAKFAVSKDITLGANYYHVERDTTPTAGPPATTGFQPGAELIHMVGVNAAAKFGPAAVTAAGAYQFGDFNKANGQDLSAYNINATAKVKAGAANINAAVLYLSGEKDATLPNNSKQNAWQQLGSNGSVSYFGPSNMWLLIRNNATINSSTALGGNDLTKGGRGLLGVFAGVDGAAGKAFYAANAGYAQVNEKRAATSGSLGTEVNGTLGYKIYDNLSASVNIAYLFLGDAAKKTGNGFYTESATNKGDADNPYAAFLRMDYSF